MVVEVFPVRTLLHPSIFCQHRVLLLRLLFANIQWKLAGEIRNDGETTMTTFLRFSFSSIFLHGFFFLSASTMGKRIDIL